MATHDLPCGIVRDLLPSYAEGLTNDITNEAVASHLTGCEDCRRRLEEMRSPLPAQGEGDDRKEIDFLKKTKRSLFRTILLSIAGVLVLVLLLLGIRIFLVGSRISSPAWVTHDLTVNGTDLVIKGTSVSSGNAISGVKISEDTPGTVNIELRSVLVSPIHRSGTYAAEWTAGAPIKEVYLCGKLIWADGRAIHPIVSDAFDSRHPYLGDASANGRTLTALHISEFIGNCTQSLQTGTEPYGWTLELTDPVSQEQQAMAADRMRSFSCVMLALVENAGCVTWNYTSGNTAQTLTVTRAEADSIAASSGITDAAACGADVASLQLLCEKLGITTMAPLSRDGENLVTQIVVHHEAADTVYGFDIGISVNGQLKTSGGMMNADNSPLARGEDMDMAYSANMLQLNEGDEVTFSVSVQTMPGSSASVVTAGEITLPASDCLGKSITLTVTGSAKDGYQIVME